MAIEVRHDVPGGIAALAGVLSGAGAGASGDLENRRRAGQLIAQLDARQTGQAAQFANARDMQAAQFENAAGLQRSSQDHASSIMEQQAAANQQAREYAAQQSAMQAEQEAKLRNENFEFQYTTKQKHDFAKLENAKRAVRSSNLYSPTEKQVMMQKLELTQAGITEPSMMPKDPNKSEFLRQPGESYLDQATGTHMIADKDGIGQPGTRFDMTPEHLQKEREHAAKEKEADRLHETQTKYLDILSKQMIQVPSGKDDDGKPQYDERPMLPGEIDMVMSRRFGDSWGPAPTQSPWPSMDGSAFLPSGLNEAMKQRFGDQWGQQQLQQQPPAADFDAHYASLPPGAEFVGPDGRRYRKPGGN